MKNAVLVRDPSEIRRAKALSEDSDPDHLVWINSADKVISECELWTLFGSGVLVLAHGKQLLYFPERCGRALALPQASTKSSEKISCPRGCKPEAEFADVDWFVHSMDPLDANHSYVVRKALCPGCHKPFWM